MEIAKSAPSKPRLSSSATAIASPSACCIGVDEVGARLFGQASRPAAAQHDVGGRGEALARLEVIAISPILKRRE